MVNNYDGSGQVAFLTYVQWRRHSHIHRTILLKTIDEPNQGLEINKITKVKLKDESTKTPITADVTLNVGNWKGKAGDILFIISPGAVRQIVDEGS